jgi:predicted nucleotidyltransferase
MTAYESDAILKHCLKEMRRRLGDRLKKAILFGSRVRGDNVPNSDYDCLAVVDEVTRDVLDAIDELAGELLYEHNAVFSIFPVSEHIYLNKTFDPFLKNVRREGVIL